MEQADAGRRDRRLRQALGALILLALGVGFVLPVLWRNPLPRASAGGFDTATLEPSDTTGFPTAIPIVSPGGTLRIAWRPTDVAPASHDGVICVTADGPGHVCVTYTVGERPADTLSREIRRRGYHVENLG